MSRRLETRQRIQNLLEQLGSPPKEAALDEAPIYLRETLEDQQKASGERKPRSREAWTLRVATFKVRETPLLATPAARVPSEYDSQLCKCILVSYLVWKTGQHFSTPMRSLWLGKYWGR